MDTADLHVMNRPPFDPFADVRITHTVQQSRTAGDHNSRGVILNHYLRGPSVGKGQHGTVFKCWDLTQNNAEVAIKVVSRHNPRADRLNQLKRKRIPRSGPHLPVTDNLGSQEYKIKKEIAVMKLCRHPHVVRLLEVIDDKLYQKVYMVMEFLGGGEIKWRDSASNPVLRVDQSRRICRDVILGLEYLHFQGIIHRDIKPANLMWTSDRRTVKITDFGVAHISAAQRFVGSGRGSGSATTDTDADLHLLFDDSELCKTAGTPSFLAPEVIFDFGTEVHSPSSSDALSAGDSNSAATLQAPAPHRPPITKAIDVWALGVTLYCLLFGRTPFRVESNHEFALYGVICTQDWGVESYMGLDRIPTEGRHHNCPNDRPCSEGAEIIKLLERLLEKDMSKRITLNEVKRHRWFLRDIPDHERWVRETLPDSKVVTAVTEDAISGAVSPMRFRWRQRITNRLTSILRTVRPQRSFRSADGHSDSDDVGVRSLPSVNMRRYNSTKKDSSLQARTFSSHATHTSGKSKEASRHTRGETHPPMASSSRQRLRTVTDLSSTPRSKSYDSRALASSTSGSQRNKSLDRQRGSASLLTPPERTAPSIHSLSPTTDETRSRSRFSLSSLRWRRGDTQIPTPSSASVTASVPVTPPMCSREPSRSILPPSEAPTISPTLDSGDAALAMRASSWGDVGEYSRLKRAQEAASMHSGAGDHDEPLDPDVVVIGAGGVATGPLPPTPSGSAGALAVGGLAPPYGTHADVLCRVLANPPLPSGSASRGSYASSFGVAGAASVTSVMMAGTSRWHTSRSAPRSLMQLSSSFSSEEPGSPEGDDNASDGDSDSFFARNSEEAPCPRIVMPSHAAPVHHGVFQDDRSASCGVADSCRRHHGVDDVVNVGEDEEDRWAYPGARSPHHHHHHHHRAGSGNAKGVFGVGEDVDDVDDDDDDEDDEEEEDDDDGGSGSGSGSGGGHPIEVRRRRPSWAVHDADEDENDEGDGG